MLQSVCFGRRAVDEVFGHGFPPGDDVNEPQRNAKNTNGESDFWV